MPVSRVANSDTFTATTPSDREIVLTRLFDAPRHLVFEAMTKPEHVRRWWGILDDKHSVPVCEIDLRPDGAWRFVGRGPMGEYGFHGVYREIAPPDRIVFTEIYDPFPDVESVVTSIFTGRVKGAYRFRWLILLALLAYSVGGDERLQRFRSLQDPEFIAQRFGGSVNMSFFELVRKYPLGNGLGGGGTSVPYFLQDRIRNVVVMENEYARILLELGIPGLLIMLTGLYSWAFEPAH